MVDAAGVVQGAWAPSPTTTEEGVSTLQLVGAETWSRFGQDIPVFAGGAKGNYQKARWMRDRLFHRSAPNDGEDASSAYQVEYEVAQTDANTRANAARWLAHDRADGGDQDSRYLAQFQRVWAYTQGIALAQLAREPNREPDAIALARYLCRHAQAGTHNGAPIIKGWPFSWNTQGDDWKDARLVTGATSWVVHGLGVFLTSSALDDTPQATQTKIRTCYQQALDGLRIHRLAGTTEEGVSVSLMTAGLTTRGLDMAASPWTLEGPDGTPMAPVGESWDYYDVLDALGYDRFDEEQAPHIGRTHVSQESKAQPVLPPKVLTEDEFRILKEEVRAKNVVTEHNLDVLSVLNHAIDHADTLGVDRSSLEIWRNEVRNGIFEVLFDTDETLWRRDLEEALAANQNLPQRQQEIRNALAETAWGRIATGGFVRFEEDSKRATPDGASRDGRTQRIWPQETPGSDRAWVFHRSAHVAIDNCSWLSLSVDYEDLTDPQMVDGLARCLVFTTLAFAKNISFGEKEYYGTHYFFDGFEDRYIAASDQQERSFHLEATTGLILALLAFAEAHPHHKDASFFRSEARALWSGVQDFVADHGFPYSSQRIQDLSTLLTSSTALIWFIDVYDRIETQNQDPNPGTSTPWGPDGAKLLPLSRTRPGGVAIGRGLYHAFQSLLSLHPQAAALFAPAALTVGFGLSGGAENDIALKTMIALRESPGPGWTPVGSIAADQVMHELASDSGLMMFFYPETDIRQWGRYQTPEGTTRAFDKNQIYAFDLQDLPDLLPYETIFGDGDSSAARFEIPHIKTKPEGGQLGVFVLDTEVPRSTIVERFLSHHLWWAHVLKIAAFLPTDGTQEAWLRTMESMFLGWFFDADAAVLIAHNGPSKDSRPFWYRDRPSTVDGAGAPFPSAEDSAQKPDTPSLSDSSREVLPVPATAYPPAPARGKGWTSVPFDAEAFDALADLWTKFKIAPVQQEFKTFIHAVKNFDAFQRFIKASEITIIFVPEVDWNNNRLFEDRKQNHPMYRVQKDAASNKQVWYFLEPDPLIETRHRTWNPNYSRNLNLLRFHASHLLELVTDELFKRGILRIKKETDTTFSVPLGPTKITYQTHDETLQQKVKEALHEVEQKQFGFLQQPVTVDPESAAGYTFSQVIFFAYPDTPGGGFGSDFVPGTIALNQIFMDRLSVFNIDIEALEEHGFPRSVKVDVVNLAPLRDATFYFLEPVLLVEAKFIYPGEQLKTAVFLAMQDESPHYRRFALGHKSVKRGFDEPEMDEDEEEQSLSDENNHFVELDPEVPFQAHLLDLLEKAVANTPPKPWGKDELRDEFDLEQNTVIDIFAPIPEANYGRAHIEPLILNNLFLYHLFLQSQSRAWPSNTSVHIPARAFVIDPRRGRGANIVSTYHRGDKSIMKVRSMKEKFLTAQERDALTTRLLLTGAANHLLYIPDLFEEPLVDVAEAFDHFRLDEPYNQYIFSKKVVADVSLANIDSLDDKFVYAADGVEFYLSLLEQAIHRPAHRDTPFEIHGLTEIDPEWNKLIFTNADTPVRIEVRPNTILLLGKWNVVPSFVEQIIRDFGYDEHDDHWRTPQDQQEVRQAILDAEDDWKERGFAAARSFDQGFQDSTNPAQMRFYMRARAASENTTTTDENPKNSKNDESKKSR